MKQLVQLQSGIKQIKEAGLQIVAISNDSVEELKKFAAKNKIEYPLLSDPDSKVIKSFGLLNGTGKPGTQHEGIANPMTILLDKDRTVRAKIPGTTRVRHNVKKLLAVWKETTKQMNKNKTTALDFKIKNINGTDVSLADYQGKVVVIVNVASKCGYTPQYEPLQKLYKKHQREGLAILGFPCNQFGGQEPGSAKDIQHFCESNYNVSFDMFSKIDVKGKNQSPLYKYLTSQETSPISSGDVKWNFEKFVIGRDGNILARFGSDVAPDSDQFLKTVASALKTKLN